MSFLKNKKQKSIKKDTKQATNDKKLKNTEKLKKISKSKNEKPVEYNAKLYNQALNEIIRISDKYVANKKFTNENIKQYLEKIEKLLLPQRNNFTIIIKIKNEEGKTQNTQTYKDLDRKSDPFAINFWNQLHVSFALLQLGVAGRNNVKKELNDFDNKLKELSKKASSKKKSMLSQNDIPALLYSKTGQSVASSIRRFITATGINA